MKGKMTNSLAGQRWRMILILAALILGGFMVTIWISYRVAHNSLAEHLAEETMPLTSDNIYSEIQRDLLRPIFISDLMALDTFVRDWVLAGEADSRPMIRYLHEIQQRYGTVTSFFVSDLSRNYYHHSGILKQVKENDPRDNWFFRVKQLPKGEDYEVNIDDDTADRSRVTVFVNYRVHDYEGRFIGVTGVGLALESVSRLVEHYEKRYGRRVFFVDREGTVTLHGEDLPAGKSLRTMPGLAQLATQILTVPGGNFTFQREGRAVYLNSRLVPEFNWYLMVEQKEDPAQRLLVRTLIGNLLLGLGVTLVVLLLAHFTLRGYQRRLEEMAAIDKLTGATNRQVFEVIFAKALQTTVRDKSPVAVVMLDIDQFKKINDRLGHIQGDRILVAITRQIFVPIRASDTICRWGGEEFVILLPGCDLDQAQSMAERMRQQVAEGLIEGTPVTISLGVAQYHEGDTPETLLHRADQAMYQAKNRGRNRVETAG